MSKFPAPFRFPFYLIGGKQILSYISQTDTAILSSGQVSFGHSVIKSTGELIMGENEESGIYISPQTLLVKGNEVFHRGNAGLETIDWKMKDGSIAGDLEVAGQGVKDAGAANRRCGTPAIFRGLPYYLFPDDCHGNGDGGNR